MLFMFLLKPCNKLYIPRSQLPKSLTIFSNFYTFKNLRNIKIQIKINFGRILKTVVSTFIALVNLNSGFFFFFWGLRVLANVLTCLYIFWKTSLIKRKLKPIICVSLWSGPILKTAMHKVELISRFVLPINNRQYL